MAVGQQNWLLRKTKTKISFDVLLSDLNGTQPQRFINMSNSTTEYLFTQCIDSWSIIYDVSRYAHYFMPSGKKLSQFKILVFVSILMIIKIFQE